MNETRINASKTGFEMNVMVDGVYEWREAKSERYTEIGICDRRGMEQIPSIRFVPVLREGEHLHRLIDGTCFITTMHPTFRAP